jgi:hypothetical protein
MRSRVSAASDLPTDGLTKRKKIAQEQVAEAVKQAIREICYMRWIEGED